MEKNNLWRLDQMADYFFVTDQLWWWNSRWFFFRFLPRNFSSSNASFEKCRRFVTRCREIFWWKYFSSVINFFLSIVIVKNSFFFQSC
jgi:hypothetical protein